MSLDAQWRKSTRSGGASGNCVEVRQVPTAVEVRDSKDVAGPTIAFTPEAWLAFVKSVREGSRIA